MKTRTRHIAAAWLGSLGLGATLALVPLSPELRAQAAAPLDLTLTSNGGDNREGGYGEMYSTVGEPFAGEEVNGVDNETTWIGFWQVLTPPATGSVQEELTPAASGPTGIVAALPNPFTSSIGIELGLAAPAQVRLVAYDMVGRPAALLVDGHREAGTIRINWQPEGMQAGSYLLRLTVDGREFPTHLVHYYR